MHARLSKVNSTGYRDHAWVDFNSYFLGLIRYDETMTTQFNFYGGPIADGLTYYGIPKSDVMDRTRRRENPIARPEEIENYSQPHFELLHEWRLSPLLTLSNTFFLVLGDGFFDYDGSWAPYSYFRITAENGFPVRGDPDTLFLPGALIRAQVTNRQWGWLPRLTLHYDRGEVMAGGELRVHRSVHWGRLQWAEEIPAGVPADYRYYEYQGAKDIASLYVHVLHTLQPGMQLMASVQYAFNRYRLFDEKFIGTDFSVPYHFINPRLGLNDNLTDAQLEGLCEPGVHFAGAPPCQPVRCRGGEHAGILGGGRAAVRDRRRRPFRFQPSACETRVAAGHRARGRFHQRRCASGGEHLLDGIHR